MMELFGTFRQKFQSKEGVKVISYLNLSKTLEFFWNFPRERGAPTKIKAHFHKSSPVPWVPWIGKFQGSISSIILENVRGDN
jgi:hypothetical protein